MDTNLRCCCFHFDPFQQAGVPKRQGSSLLQCNNLEQEIQISWKKSRDTCAMKKSLLPVCRVPSECDYGMLVLVVGTVL